MKSADRSHLCMLILLAFLNAYPASAQTGYDNDYVVRQELIFAEQQEHVHGSSLVILPNGDKLVVWFQGSGERTADDVRIMGSRLKKGAKSWEPPFQMADTRDIPDCNPVLFLNANNKLFLVWIAVQANQWENSILRFKTSTDYHAAGPPVWEWQDDILLKPDDRFAEEVQKQFQYLPKNTAGWAAYAPTYDKMIIEASKDLLKRSIGWMTRIHPLILESGKILLPLYSDGLNMSLVAISEDQGATWRPSLPIVGRGPIQPALAQKNNGQIVAYMRDSGDSPSRVQVSTSLDEGESWSAALDSEIPNTASVELLALKDGIWAFLGNDIDDGRYRLSLFLSDDQGETWNRKVRIEDKPKDQGGFSYPSLVEDDHGLLHMTYSYHPEKAKKSIKYVVVNPGKIKE